jgi:hypothetical protein
LHFIIGRQLAMGSADIVRATLRSGIATACGFVGVLGSMAIAEFSLTGPMSGLNLACIFAAAGWCWLGLAAGFVSQPSALVLVLSG